MTRYIYTALFCLLLLVISCGGGTSVKNDPAPSHPAQKHIQKGVALYQRGCFQASLTAFMKAHELFSASDRLPGIAMSLNNIGNVYRYIGDTRSALLFFQEAYEIYSRLDDSKGRIQALANKAAMLIQAERLDEATATIQRAKDLAESSDQAVAQVLNNQGILLTRQGQYDAAESVLLQALAATDPENLHARATAFSSLGNLMSEKSDHQKAIEFYNKALSLDRQTDFHAGLADNLKAIGRVYHQLDKHDRAASYFQRSIKIYALFNNQDQVIRTLALLEESAARSGMDLTVTRHFVEKWLKGEMLEHPCP